MQLSKLGPYELGETIGKGGMGSVYRATDTTTGAQVAIKALNPQLAQAEGFRERFEAEIESLKTLRHEGIVRLYGYGEQEGVLFYSMELVEGTSLEEELKAGRRFDWREVTDIAIQLCYALKHAHDHGVVHRDIKPANILIDSQNTVKLADFGIARLFGNTQLTTAGGVLGTADYMSPEQAEGRPVTDRCDQYSLGGVMYALLAGRTPFRAKSLPEMLQLQRYAEPEPVRRYARDTPPQMEEAIAQLLSKDPQQRFPNVKVVARHLEAMVRALSRPAHDDFAVREDEVHPSDPQLTDHRDYFLSATRSDEETGDPIASPTLHPSDLPADSLSDSNVPPDTMTIGVDNGVPPPDAAASPPPSSSFTMVDPAGKHAEQLSWKSPLAQAAGLLILFAILGSTALHFLRPQSADALYATILVGTTSGQASDLREIEDEIDQFLTRFPNDSRVQDVEEISSQVLQAKLERRLEIFVLLKTGANKDLLSIESHFLRAMKLSETDVQEAVDVLDSLIAFYDGEAVVPITNGSKDKINDREFVPRYAACLNLAKQKLEKFRESLAEVAARQLPELEARLREADRLTESEPLEATKIYQAIIRLFGQQHWASEAVAEARRKLDNL